MTTNLEDLVRDTLAGRAATVTRGAELIDPSARRRTNGWLVAAAAAAVVAAAGTAVAVTHAIGRHHGEAAGGSARPTCTASLPPAWSQALAGPRWTVGGLDAWPAATAPNGAMMAESVDPGGTGYRTSLITPDGDRTALLTVPRRRDSSPWGADTDGRYAVFDFAPDEQRGDSAEPPIDDLVLVDARTGRRRHLLPDAPAPTGYVVAWRGAVIQDGTVYWGMDEPGDAPKQGIVLAYDAASHRYRVLAHLDESAAVLRDPRGVHWAGGLVPAAGVPRTVPVAPASLQWRQNVVSDGTSYAWAGRTDAPDSQVVYWVRGTAEHHWRVRSTTRHGGPFHVTSVSGRFVFGQFPTGPAYVIDIRTGAAAALGRSVDYGPTTSGRSAYFSLPTPPGSVATVRVDTAKLPELHC